MRLMPCGPTSNTHAMIIATGKPTIRKTTTNVTVHSGRRSAGITTEEASVTIQATAP